MGSAQKKVIWVYLPSRLLLPAPPYFPAPFILRLVRHKSLTLVANGAEPRPIVTKSSWEAVCLQAMHSSGDVQFQASTVLLSGDCSSSRSAFRRFQQSTVPGDVQFAPGNRKRIGTCAQSFFLLPSSYSAPSTSSPSARAHCCCEFSRAVPNLLGVPLLSGVPN